MQWKKFDKFEKVYDEYLPASGQGDSYASQMVVCVCKLIHRWYNDGDIFDNSNYLKRYHGEYVSSYANWLYTCVPETRDVLARIYEVHSQQTYERLLWDLANLCFSDANKLANYAMRCMSDVSVYDCKGPFEIQY